MLFFLSPREVPVCEPMYPLYYCVLEGTRISSFVFGINVPIAWKLHFNARAFAHLDNYANCMPTFSYMLKYTFIDATTGASLI